LARVVICILIGVVGATAYLAGALGYILRAGEIRIRVIAR